MPIHAVRTVLTRISLGQHCASSTRTREETCSKCRIASVSSYRISSLEDFEFVEQFDSGASMPTNPKVVSIIRRFRQRAVLTLAIGFIFAAVGCGGSSSSSTLAAFTHEEQVSHTRKSAINKGLEIR